MKIKKGDYIRSPRFLNVRITEVYPSVAALEEAGFRETTHFQDPDYEVFGRSVGLNRMEFAAGKK